ncbi:MAG: hypothetical protein R3A79_01135 [Nannocystaceae bacterium]
MSAEHHQVASDALRADAALQATPEGRRAVELLVGGGKSFIWDLTFGSVGRVVRAAIVWTIGFFAVGVAFQVYEINTQAVAGAFKVAQFVLVLVLFPLAGLISGIFWGIYRSLILQVEAVERAVQTAIDAVLAKVSETAELAGTRLSAAIGVDRFEAILNAKIDELVAAAGQQPGGRVSRFARRLPRWMLAKLLGTVRAVIVRSFLKKEKRDEGADKPDEAGEGRKISLAGFTSFMQENAFGLVFEQIKGRIALLRLIPMIGLVVFVALPLLFSVIE